MSRRLPKRRDSSAPLQTKEIHKKINEAQNLFRSGKYRDALKICETCYVLCSSNVDNLLLMGAIHFQLRNLSESMFYSQQCLRVEPTCAEAHSTIGNSLKELGIFDSALDFYRKAIRLQPRFADAYNNLACLQFQMGKSKEAIDSLNTAISLDPSHSDALCNLGTIHKTIDQPNTAKGYFLEAIRVSPKCAIAWSNLGGVFIDCGEHKKAIESYRQALNIMPTFADAHSNMGNALRGLSTESKDQESIQQAKASYEAALELRSDFALARGNLALHELEYGSRSDAAKQFRQVLRIDPNYADALSNLAGLYFEEEKIDECIRLCLRALRIKPDHFHAYNNLGNALKAKGFLSTALHSYDIAIKLRSSFVIPKSNVGAMLQRQGKHDLSMETLQEALNLDPLFTPSDINMGNEYAYRNENENAIKCYGITMDRQEGRANCVANLNTAIAYHQDGDLDGALKFIMRAVAETDEEQRQVATPAALILSLYLKSSACDWSCYDQDVQRLQYLLSMELSKGDTTEETAAILQPIFNPFFQSLLEGTNHLLPLAERIEAQTALNKFVSSKFPFLARKKKGEEIEPPIVTVVDKVRIGYVSSQFGQFSQGRLYQALYGLHDKERFEVYCYSLVPSDDSPPFLKMKEGTNHFLDMSNLESIEDAAARLYNDNLHVLVDMDGPSTNNIDAASFRCSALDLFSLRLAPIQISMGRYGTTGSSYVDYVVTNESTVPKENQCQYIEKILYVPGMLNSCRESKELGDLEHIEEEIVVANEVDDDNDDIRSAYGISYDAFVYACFNRPHKIDPAIFRAWMCILQKAPMSNLLLVRYNEHMEYHLREEARRHDVDPDRLIFMDLVPFNKHAKRYAVADLFLDTSICSGSSAVCEALWAGTPTICMAGDKACNRVGSALLISAGVRDLVVEDMDQYMNLAVSLNSDEERFIGIVRKLEECRMECSLFDTEQWVRHFESTVEQAIMMNEKGLGPDHISSAYSC